MFRKNVYLNSSRLYHKTTAPKQKAPFFTKFELLHHGLKRHLADIGKANEVRSEIQHLATTYVNFVQDFTK